MLLALSLSSSAQWITLRLPDTPRLATGEPNLAAPAPKNYAGKSALSGIWQVIIPPRTAPGGGRAGLRIDLPKGYQIPMQPWAKALWDKRYDVDLGAGRPSERCLPHIGPDALFFELFKIIETPQETVILQEEFNFYRQIHTDGRKLPVNPNPAWLGFSVGTWEDDTFIVDSLGFKIPSWQEYGWFDNSGIPYSEALHTIEKFHRVNFGRMHLDVTVEDPAVFTRPWTYGFDFELQPDTELIEDICENERDSPHLLAK